MNGVHPLVEEMTRARQVELLREMKGAMYDAVVYGRELVKHGVLVKDELNELILIQTRTEAALHRRDQEEGVRT